MKLRDVTEADARLLFEWRNDEQTRHASLSRDPVRWEDHLAWLRSSLASDSRKLVIVEEQGVAIGTVRADLADSCYELSWTVAPSARGKGLSRKMVALFRETLPGKVCARVREDNPASRKIAESLGLTCTRIDDGVGFYEQAR